MLSQPLATLGFLFEHYFFGEEPDALVENLNLRTMALFKDVADEPPPRAPGRPSKARLKAEAQLSNIAYLL